MKLYSVPRIATAAALAVTLLAGMTACSTTDAEPTIGVDNGAPVTAAATKPAEPESIRGTLVDALSGDTVVITPVGEDTAKPNGQPNITVRILGISAPKLNECGGPEAAAKLKSLASISGFVRVQFDENAEGQTVGRLIAADGTGGPFFAASRMTSEGFASAWHEGSTAPEDFETLVENTSIAKRDAQGNWATCDTVGLGSSIPAAKMPTGPNS